MEGDSGKKEVCALSARRTTGWMRGREKSAFVESLFGAADLLFGLEPVVELRAGFVAALDVELISSSADAFFEWKLFARGRGFFCAARGGRHEIYLPQPR